MWFYNCNKECSVTIYGESLGILANDLSKIYLTVNIIEESPIQAQTLSNNIKYLGLNNVYVKKCSIENSLGTNLLILFYENIKNVNLNFLMNNFEVLIVICENKKEKLSKKIKSIKDINALWYPVDNLFCLAIFG